MRASDTQGWLTIKGKTVGVSRAEYEYEIPHADAEALLELCVGALIEKTRWRVEYRGHVWEVDRFYGANRGLVIAEIELQSEAEAFAHPDWLGEEVSAERRYSNRSLSQSPYREWGG